MMPTHAPIDWDGADLVIFDVDGTLYHQRALRARMAAALLLDGARRRSFHTLAILRAYRRFREELGDEGGAFLNRQYEETAARLGCRAEQVCTVVGEWMERRPLRHLRACRLAGLDVLFDGLRRAGKRIAIFSDYPAVAKLEALDLKADLVVSAADEAVQRLKPHPAGLHHILEASGVAAARALVIGDRFDRDWAAADRAGIPALIRTRGADRRCPTFRTYRDPLFAPLLQHAPPTRQTCQDRYASQL